MRRTDLALFDLDLANRTITCNLVEVKCYAQRLGLSGYNHLKQQMIEQLNQSEHVIQVHFDPRRVTPDRPDRLLKTRELSTVLEFYMERGLRYGLMEGTAGAEARTFLDLLEEGYALRLSRSGLVFDFDKSGTDPAEHEAGVEFHRVGVDLIRSLVDHAVSRSTGREGADGGGSAGEEIAGGGGTTGEPLSATPSAEPPLPRLDSAAFLVAERARSTTEPVGGGSAGGDTQGARPEEPTVSDDVETSPPAPDEGQPVEGARPGESSESDDVEALPPVLDEDGAEAPLVLDEDGAEALPLVLDEDSAEASPPAVDEGELAETTRAVPRTGRRARAGGAGAEDERASRGAERPSHRKEIARDANEPVDPESGASSSAPPSRAPAQPLLPVQSEEPLADPAGPAYDAVLGATGSSPQYGLIGRTSGRTVALDLNQTHTVSLFGVQGGGKSYTLGSVIEMACMPVAGVNRLPQPLASVIFHYSATLDYGPEFTSMAAPNAVEAEVSRLRADYGAAPQALDDLVILTPAAKVEARRAEYPGIEVLPIAFVASELKASHWKFLMGAVGSQSLYIRQLALIMKKLRGDLTLDALRQGVQDSGLSDYLKDLALLRLRFAEDYVDDVHRLTDILRPGRLVIVDLRDEFIEKDEALGLFVVLLQLFAETTYEGRRFNKLVVFDEAHKYIDSPDLVAGLVEVVREMRHKGTTVMVASQDPPSVPTSLIELSTHIMLHKFNSPAWLKHIQKANAALDGLTPAKLAALGPGEAYVWSSRSTDDAFTRGAVKVRCRPRVTRHGGGTKTAVGASGDEG